MLVQRSSLRWLYNSYFIHPFLRHSSAHHCHTSFLRHRSFIDSRIRDLIFEVWFETQCGLVPYWLAFLRDAMSQSMEVEPYEEVVDRIHYNTPVGSRSSSPHDNPQRSSPLLSQSNGPRQTNSLLRPPPQPALRSYELADPEPWQECAATLFLPDWLHGS